MAHITVDKNRNKKLINLLIRLSDPELNMQAAGVRRTIYTEFESIYWLGTGNGLYRHLYSDLFDTITSIDNSPTNDIEILVQNIQMLCLSYDSSNSKIEDLDIGDALIKLYDHISLDVRRLQYTKSLNFQHQGSLFEVANKITETERNIEKKISTTVDDVKDKFDKQIIDTKEKILKDSEEEASKMRSEYISILGIFSSVVLAFIGGMTFSTSVLNNIHNASIYRLLIITALIGMVFIAMIWLLMDFIKTIHGQTKRNYWYIIVPESILAVIIVLSFWAYKGEWFKGEEAITSLRSQQVIQETVSNNNCGI